VEGKFMDKRTKNLEGKVIGQWTVLRYEGIIKGNAHWYCRCSCGFEKAVKAQYLIGGKSSKCQTCAIPKRKNIVGTIPNHYWRYIISNANKRDIQILITAEECYNLLQDQEFKCTLSGLELYMSKNASEHLEGKTTASLDRIDSSKPYEKGNVQWLHKDVNMMKHIFTQEHFIELCKKVAFQSSSSRLP
jgi:hypothetical protein